MTRSEIYNKIFQWLKQQVAIIEENPNKMQQLQMGNIYDVFPYEKDEAIWEHDKIDTVVFEIMNEFVNAGFLCFGKVGRSSNDGYPWFTITEYGKNAIMQEDWMPYDPEGYIALLKMKIPSIDDITLSYIGEAVGAYNRRYLLSATITMGAASENLMLLLIEAYTNWIADTVRKTNFQKKIENKFISTQYKEFKKEFINDLKSLPKEFQADWETYLDGIFNFIRLNRNDAGHPTGKQFDAKIIYANLQIFAEYAQFIYKLLQFLMP